ncbi:MAG: carboxymuconolactone decarboxylase family protein [Gammaproteobacteria bacterium]|nr:carboxymuconolactone decarboxylase family protein [Gammaproteobacteria bacterium]
MARIPYVDPSEATDTTRSILDRLGNKNIFRMLGHSESHLRTYCRLGNAIRYKGELDAGLRELAITRTGILCGSEYEVIAHKRIGKDVGLTQAKVDALDHGIDADVFSELERDVLRFTDDVVTNDRASDETFNKLSAQLTPGALVELYLSIGFYIMTSKFLNTFDIDLET